MRIISAIFQGVIISEGVDKIAKPSSWGKWKEG
jgi:hypothetical protein